jgi:hypothetical protein
MFPLSDYLPTLRASIVTYALILLMGVAWIFVQGGESTSRRSRR